MGARQARSKGAALEAGGLKAPIRARVCVSRIREPSPAGDTSTSMERPGSNTDLGIIAIMATLSELLVQARRGADLSQAELARAAETSQSALARYESGVTEPSVATLERVLRACGQQLQLTTAPVSVPVTAPGLSARAQLGASARRLRRLRRAILKSASAHGVRRVRVFGSIARGEATPESDVDLLVDLAPGRTLIDLAAFRREVCTTLGVNVDVATEDMLQPRIRDVVLSEAVSL